MHNQNEMQQHEWSRHVDRPFLYTYVPNSDAESFFFTLGPGLVLGWLCMGTGLVVHGDRVGWWGYVGLVVHGVRASM